MASQVEIKKWIKIIKLPSHTSHSYGTQLPHVVRSSQMWAARCRTFHYCRKSPWTALLQLLKTWAWGSLKNSFAVYISEHSNFPFEVDLILSDASQSMVMDLWQVLLCGPLIVYPCQSKLQPRTIAQPPYLWAVSTEGGCTMWNKKEKKMMPLRLSCWIFLPVTSLEKSKFPSGKAVLS